MPKKVINLSDHIDDSLDLSRWIEQTVSAMREMQFGINFPCVGIGLVFMTILQ